MKRFGTLRLVNDVTKANSELISNLLAKEDIEYRIRLSKSQEFYLRISLPWSKFGRMVINVRFYGGGGIYQNVQAVVEIK